MGPKLSRQRTLDNPDCASRMSSLIRCLLWPDGFGFGMVRISYEEGIHA